MTKEKDYIKIFYKLSQAFGTAESVDELLELIVQSAIDTMDGKASCLFLADEKQDLFKSAAQIGLSDSYLHASPIRAKRIVDEIVKSGYFAFEDATTDARLENHEAKKKEGIASILTVPVLVKKRPIGVLSLYTAERRNFQQDEIDFLKALAGQGGIAIENARLVERIEKNASLFLDLATNINSSLDIKKILHIMTEEICKAFGMKGATIRLRNDETGALDLVASSGLSEMFLNKGQVSAEKSIAKALKGETVVINDINTDKQLQYREETLAEGISSMVVVPIKSKDEVIGVMRLFSEYIRDYPNDILTVLNALAHTGALAIQNASMYLILQKDKESLEADMWSHRSYF
jgi:GAF domain-containing protein